MQKCTVWPQGWHNEELFLHHNTAPAHNALSMQKLPANNGKAIVSHLHTPQIYHLVPFMLFLKLKLAMKGRRFHNIRKIQNNCRLQVPVPNRWYSQMLWTTAQSLGSLYQITWGLPWCKQHWVTGKFTETKILSSNFDSCTEHLCIY
jgi:hypothetical protein